MTAQGTRHVTPKNTVARRTRRAAAVAAAIATLSLRPADLRAADTWDNENGNANWSLGLNWADNVKPTSADDVTFPVGFPNGDTSIIFSSPENALSMTINDSYSFGNAGASLTLAGTGNITVAAGKTATMAVAINGSGGVTKLGTGTLAMTQGNNFTGGLFINAGTLSADQNNRLGSGSNTITFNGGQLVTTTSFANSRAMVINAGGGQLAANSSTLGTHSGSISGTGPLTFNGLGTVVLGGSNNYSGATLLSSGLLQIAATNSASSASAFTLSSGTTFDLNGIPATIGSLAGAGSVTLHSATLTSGGNNSSTTYSGSASGSGGLFKTGTGILTLSGSHSYTGTTTVSTGVIRLAAADRLHNSSALSVSSGATFDLNSFAETVGSTAGAGNIALGSATLNTGGDDTSSTFSGSISGAGGLTKTGTGVFTVSGSSSYAGSTLISAGTLRLGASNCLPDTTAISGSGTFDLNNFSETIGFLAGAGSVVLGSGTLTTTIGTGFTITYGGVVSGTGGLTKEGTGALVLSGSNTYTGATTINAGVLQNSTAHRISDQSAVTVASVATFNLGAFPETIGSLAGAGTVSMSAAALTVGGDNTSTTFSGALIGSGGSLTKVGTGTQTLAGTATYNGGTNITAGVLEFSSPGNLGSGGIVIDGGTLRTGAAIGAVSHHIDLGAAGGTIDTNGFTSVFNNGIYGPGALTKTGAGTLVVTVLNITASSTTVSAGTLQIGNGGANGFITGDIVNNANVTWNRIDSPTYSSVISGTGSVTKMGFGTLTLAGSNIYSGATSVTNGSLALAAADRFSDFSALSLDAGTTFNMNNFSDTIGSLAGAGTVAMGSGSLTANADHTSTTFSGLISGTGALTKVGGGILSLTGSNSYSGGTTVSIGTLAVNNTSGSGTGTGPVVVNGSGNGILAGTGTITNGGSALVTINSGGRLAPGNSIGNLTMDRLTLSAGSILDFEVGPAGVNDKATITATDGLTLNGGAINITSAGIIATGIGYPLLDYSGTYAGTMNNLSIPSVPAGYDVPTLSENMGTTAIEITFNAATNGGTTWTLNGSSAWSVGSNWSGGLAPNGTDARATFAGAITAPATVAVYGSTKNVDALIFNNVNSYALAGTTPMTMTGASGGSNIDVVIGSHSIAVPISFNSATTTVNVVNSASVFTISGATSGSAPIQKEGSGTLAFTAASTRTGPNTINAGTVLAQNGTALGSGNVQVDSDARLTIDGGITVNNHITILGGGPNGTGGASPGQMGALHSASGSNTWTGNILLAGAGQIITDPALNQISADGELLITGTMSGPGTWAKSRAGDVVLRSSNSYAGLTRVFFGRLIIEADGALGAAGSNNTATGNTFQLNTTTTTGTSTIAFRAPPSSPAGFTYSTNEWINTGGNGSTGTGAQIDNLGGANTFAGKIGFNGLNVSGSVQSSVGVTSGSLELSGSLYTSDVAPASPAARTITKLGVGTLIISGDSSVPEVNDQNAPLINSRINVNAGTVNMKGILPGVTTWDANAGTLNVTGGTFAPASVIARSGGQVNFSGGVSNIGSLDVQAASSASSVANSGNTVRANTLAIAATGNYDINNNRFILQSNGTPSVLAAVRQYIINGRGGTDFANATWQGAGGISSSSAAPGGIGDGVNPGDGISFAVGYVENSFLPTIGLPSYSSFGGQTVDSDSLLIRFTRGADCNLDGRVNTDDVTIVGALYNNGASGEWALGDFDYDGICESDDVTVLGALYDATAPALSVSQLTAQYGSEFAAAFARGRAMAAVPEPSCVSLLALCGLAGRRRRRQRDRLHLTKSG